MTQKTIAQYLELSKLQMATEAFWDGWNKKTGASEVDWGKYLKDGSALERDKKSYYERILIEGNGHGSKYSTTDAALFFDDYEVIAHCPNTDTGFSGTLFEAKRDIPGTDIKAGDKFLSFRSTEFVDDQIRDSVGTNQSIKEVGFAFGPISDMEDWYAQLLEEGKIPTDQKLTVVGYSLGGHLANAFGILRHEEGKSPDLFDIITFNGAGTGLVNEGTLAQRLEVFRQVMTGEPEDDPILRAIARTVNPEEIKRLTKLREDLLDMAQKKLQKTLEIEQEILGYHDSQGNSPTIPADNAYTKNANIYYAQFVAAIFGKEGDYQRDPFQGVIIGGMTSGAGSANISTDPSPLNRHFGGTMLSNIEYIIGSGPTFVASSGYYHNRTNWTEVQIENQPDYRGDSALLKLPYWSLWNMVDLWDLNAGGDTHSLVLLVDSLALMNTFAKLNPSLTIADLALMFTTFTDAAAQTVEGQQGKAEGNLLEAGLDALAKIFGIPSDLRNMLTSSGKSLLDGGTWNDMEFRNKFYEVLQQVNTQIDALKTGENAPQFDVFTLAGQEPGRLIAWALQDNATGLAIRYALQMALPFAVVGADYSQYADMLSVSGHGVSYQWIEDRVMSLLRFSEYNASGKADHILNAADVKYIHSFVYPTILPVPTELPVTIPRNLLGLYGFNISIPFFSIGDIRLEDRGSGQNLLVNGLDGYVISERKVVFGNSGTDELIGGSRDDRLYGEHGDDILRGNGGNDYLEGGYGDDTYYFQTGDGNDLVYDVDGQGQLIINHVVLGAIGQLREVGFHLYEYGTGDALIRVQQVASQCGSGTDLIIRYGNQGDTITVYDWREGDLGIRLIADEPPPVLEPITIEGSNEDDIIHHQQAATQNTINTYGGNDKVYIYRDGNHKVDGGSGNDQIIVVNGQSDNLLIGGIGQDILAGGVGNDILFADDEFELTDAWIQSATGTPKSKGDYLYGGDGSDTLIGSDQNDLLIGGAGDDIMYGGDGDDMIWGQYWVQGYGDPNWSVTRTISGEGDYLHHSGYASHTGDFRSFDNPADAGNDTVYAGAGNDWVFMGGGNDFVDAGSGDDVVYGGGGHDEIHGGSGNDVLYGDSLGKTSGYGNDRLYGGDGNDLIFGNAGHDHLYGGAGNDHLHGDDADTPVEHQGNDYLDGGDGNDVLIGYGGNDELYGGTGNDILFGDWDSNDFSQNYSDDDYLDGGDGDDILYGYKGNNILIGGKGNDILVSDLTNGLVDKDIIANDHLYGGEGDDTLISAGGTDYLDGGTGSDTYRITLKNGNTVTLNESGNDYDTVYLLNVSFGDATITRNDGAVSIQSSLGTVILTNNGKLFEDIRFSDIRLTQSDLQSILNGEIVGEADKDNYLSSRFDITKLTGSNGNDTFNATLAGMTLTGGSGNDTYYLDHADAQVIEKASEGHDTIILNGNTDTYTLGAHIEDLALTNNAQVNTLIGNELDNYIAGNHLNQTLDGGAGNDRLYGGAGTDTYLFRRGSGHDVIGETGVETSVLRFEDIDFNDLQMLRTGSRLTLVYGDDSVELHADNDQHSWQIIDKNGVVNTIHIADYAQPETPTIPTERQKVELASGASLLERAINQYQTEFYDTTAVYDWWDYHLNFEAANIDQINTIQPGQDFYSEKSQTVLTGYETQQTSSWGWEIVNTHLTNVDPGTTSRTYTLNGKTYYETVTASTTPYIEEDPLAQNPWDPTQLGGTTVKYRTQYNITTSVWTESITTEVVPVYQTDVYQTVSQITLTQAGEFTTNANRVQITGSVGDDTICIGGAPGQELPFGVDHVWQGGGIVDGGAGNDTIYGSVLNDQIIGGTGNDWMNGRQGSDIYWIDSTTASGHDIIDDTGYSDSLDSVDQYGNWPVQNGDGYWWMPYTYPNNIDSVVLAGGVTLGDLTVRWSDSPDYQGSIVLTWRQDSSVTIVIRHDEIYNITNPMSPAFGQQLTGRQLGLGIERVVFDDGSYVTIDELIAMASSSHTNRAPQVMQQQTDVAINQNDLFSLTLSAGLFTDQDGDALTYSMTLADGSALPSWLTFNAATRTLSGTPDNSDVGGLSLRITATDPSGLAASQIFDLSVTNVNDAPEAVGTLADQHGQSGQSWQYVIPTDAFRDIDGDSLTYSITMADGSALPSWLSFDAATRTLSGTPTQPDNLSFIISVTDPHGASATQSLTFSVTADGIYGTAGDDTLYGTAAAESIYGLAGNDTIYVGDKDKAYGGSGNDTIRVNNGATHFVVEGGEGDDILTGGSDTLFGTYRGGAGNDSITVNYWSAGNTIEGGTGDDMLIGGHFGETYLFNLGDGKDTILDYQSSDHTDPLYSRDDRIVFGQGINPQDWTLSRSGNDFVMTHSNGSDQITIKHWFVNWRYRIERFEFADGTVWTPESLQAHIFTYQAGNGGETIQGWEGLDILIGGAGNDTIYVGDKDKAYGGSGNDTIRVNNGATHFVVEGGEEDDILTSGSDTLFGTYRGGAGNDTITVNYWSAGNTIEGGTGDDKLTGGHFGETYLFNLGDGKDTILDYQSSDHTDPLYSRDDRIVFGQGINPQDWTLSRSGNDFVMTHSNGSDQITIKHWFVNWRYRIERFEFADGTVWTPESLQAHIFTYQAGNGGETIQGWEGLDILIGGAGNDTIYAGNGDQAYGGAGNDILRAEERGSTGIVLDGGDGDDFIYGGLEISGTYRGGNGNDTISIYKWADTSIIEGGKGDDIITGGYGENIYLFNLGDGRDTITDYSDLDWAGPDAERKDRIIFGEGIEAKDWTLSRNGNDFVMTHANGTDQITIKDWFVGVRYRIELFEFADGTVWTSESLKSHIFTYQAGNNGETIRGWEGQDILIGGAGNDTIYAGNGDQAYGGAGNDILRAEERGSTGIVLDGGDGDDFIYGGHEVMGTYRGGNGNDTISIYKWAEASIIEGGKGDDTIIGGYGQNTYLFNLGDGRDTITDYSDLDWAGPDAELKDRIIFGEGIRPQDWTLSRNGNDFVMTHANGTDQITIKDWFVGVRYRIELFEFADGTVWTSESLKSHIFTYQAGNNGETIRGWEGQDILIGGAGNDTIYAGNGDQAYGGAGNDILRAEERGSTGIVLDGGDGDDFIYGGLEISGTYRGGNGNDTISIYKWADTSIIEGGKGDDIITGGYGENIYLFNLGDGRDTITDYSDLDWAGPDAERKDRIIFGEGIEAKDWTLSRNGNDFVMTHANGTDQITIKNWFTGVRYQVELFEFADGTVWTSTQLTTEINEPKLVTTAQTVQTSTPLLSSQTQNLIQAMATFAPPEPGQVSLSTSYQDALNPVLVSNWK